MADARRRLGAVGETLAALHYERHGFTVLARNWRCRHGELDLVVRRGGLVVFVEVKTRSSTAFGHPAEAVTAAKQRRLRLLAVRWLATTGTSAAELRFDVVAVLGGRLEVVADAF
jgi:putative endonuclease